MANGQTIRLAGPRQIETAHRLIDKAPQGAVVNIQEARRTNQQNDLMWALLSDLARAKPEGRVLPTHKWKSLVMDYAGLKPDWEPGLDGGVVCVGYKSSRLSKASMSDVIEAIYEYGARHGVAFQDGGNQ